MVKNDPEKPVRQGAARALVNMDAGWSTLVEWLSDPKATVDLKIVIMTEACREHSSKIKVGLRKIIDQEWKVPNSRLLEGLARELAQAKTADGELYGLLIKHEKENIRLWAIRGIQNNKIASLRPALQELSTGNGLVNKVAKEALEDM
jgi:hypothetical protein